MEGAFGAFSGRFVGIDLVVDRKVDLPGGPWLSLNHLDGELKSDVRMSAGFEGMLEPTAIAHELRHFHDYLLSPLGAFVFRARFSAVCNGLGFLPALRNLSVAVPVPMASWLSMSQADRDNYWSRAESLFSAMGIELNQPLQLPIQEGWDLGAQALFEHSSARILDDEGIHILEVPTESLGHLALATASQFERGRYATSGWNIDGEAMYPFELFEANALTTQMQHVGMAGSLDAASDFLDGLMAGRSERYGDIFRRMIAAALLQDAEGQQIMSPAHIARVATYSLLGTLEPTSRTGQPVLRFLAAVLSMQRDPCSLSESSVASFERWDRELQNIGFAEETTLEGLKRSLQSDDSLLRLVEEFRTHAPSELQEAVKPVHEVAVDFVAARREICERFLADPDSYTRPGAYLRSLPRLPRPLVRIAIGQGIDELETLGRLITLGWTDPVQAGTRRWVMRPPQDALPGSDSFNPENVIDFTDLNMAIESLVSDSGAADPGQPDPLDRMLGSTQTVRVIRPQSTPPSSMEEARKTHFIL